MEINSGIYREIESFDVSEFFNKFGDDFGDDFANYILQSMCAKSDFGKPVSKLTDEEEDELDLDQFIKINRICLDSMLYQGLRLWYKDLSVVDCVRGGLIEDGYLYYGTGIGYDTISSDLLGCDCNGIATNDFIAFLNEDYKTNKQGGYEYMKAKDHLSSVSGSLLALACENN